VQRDLRLRDQRSPLCTVTEQQDIVERFGRLEDPLRLLIWDVASRG
jgi:hypothetical protein